MWRLGRPVSSSKLAWCQIRSADVVAGDVEDGRGGGAGPQLGAVAADEFQFGALAAPMLAAHVVGLEAGLALLVHEALQRLLQQVFDLAAQQRRHLRVDEGDEAERVDLPDAFVGAVDDAAEALLAAFDRGQLALARLDDDAAGLAAAVGARQQDHWPRCAIVGAGHLGALAARRAAVDGRLEEDVELVAPGAPYEVAEAVPADRRARYAQQLGAGHVRLQDAAVEGDHEVTDRGQQVEFVEVGLLLLVAQAIWFEAAIELLLGQQRGRHVHVFVHVTPPCSSCCAVLSRSRWS
jgi:hypothetical protein